MAIVMTKKSADLKYTDQYSQSYQKWARENPIEKNETEIVALEFLIHGTGPKPYIKRDSKDDR